jgi:PAS domain S-box-containing protein
MKRTTSILVVDDDPAILHLYSEILRAEGYQVWAASTGHQGLQAARERRPDLVLLDVILPDLSGIEVCRQIKAEPALSDVFVVLVSGAATSADQKVDGLETGADDYLVKPLDVAELLARLRTLVRLRNTLAALRVSEQRHRQLVEILPEAVGLIDLQGRFLAGNPQAAEMLGYANPGELLERSIFDVTRPEDHERVKADIAGTLETGALRNAQYRLLRKSGDPFPADLSAAVASDADGQPSGVVLVAHQTTERKRAEQWTAAFSQLGHRLSAAAAPDQAARIILDIAADLFGWDAGYVHLYSESKDRLIPVLTFDTVAGQRTPVPPASFTLDPSPLMRRVMKQGAQLINPDNEAPLSPPRVPFGDTTRRSASMMYVPIRSGSNVIGILSVQSYTPRAYAPDDLRLLQTLADHCGDALRRIKVAESLWEAEVRCHDIVENATEGIFQTTLEGRFRTANPALAQMLGYQTPEALMAAVTDIGRQLHLRPETRQELKRLLDAQGSVRGFEFQNYRKDGSIIWFSINGRAVRDTTGTVQYYEGTINDITERKWVDDLLRGQRDFGVFLSSISDLKAATERLLKIVLENEGLDGGAVYLLNPETQALDLAAHQGLSAGFAKRASHFPAVPARDRLASPNPLAAPAPARPLAGMLRRLRREGLLALEALPIQHGGHVVAVLVVGTRVRRQIPARARQVIDALAAQAGGAIARIRAEQSMLTSRHLLEKTIHHLHSAVIIVDARTTLIQECNPAATRMFGRRREEMIGQTPSFLHLSEAMREEFNRHLLATVNEKGPLSEFEFELKRKDGAPFPTEAILVPIRNGIGHVVTWVGVLRDISERKQTEAGLRQLSRRILEAQESERQRVARELHDSVNQVIAAAKMRVRRVAERAPLSPVARELLTRCDELLVRALEENRRIAHDLRPADLDTLGLAEACRNLCRQFQTRTNLVVKTRLARFARRCPPATELNFFRIVQEALNNVEKHARARTVRLRIAAQRGGLLLTIQDDGRGFDPQAVKPASRKGKGVGLANMRERATVLGGTCEVQSVPNHGTAITVRVPCQDHPPPTPDHRPQTPYLGSGFAALHPADGIADESVHGPQV